MTSIFVLSPEAHEPTLQTIAVSTYTIRETYISDQLDRITIPLNDGYLDIWYGRQQRREKTNTLAAAFFRGLDYELPAFKSGVAGIICISFHKLSCLDSFSHEYPELLRVYTDIPYRTLEEVAAAVNARTLLNHEYSSRMLWTGTEQDALQRRLLNRYMYVKSCKNAGVQPNAILSPYAAQMTVAGCLSQNPKATCPITMNPFSQMTTVCVSNCGHVFSSAAQRLQTCPLCRKACMWTDVKIADVPVNAPANPINYICLLACMMVVLLFRLI